MFRFILLVGERRKHVLTSVCIPKLILSHLRHLLELDIKRSLLTGNLLLETDLRPDGQHDEKFIGIEIGSESCQLLHFSEVCL